MNSEVLNKLQNETKIMKKEINEIKKRTKDMREEFNKDLEDFRKKE
jgi:hypothetical protein